LPPVSDFLHLFLYICPDLSINPKIMSFLKQRIETAISEETERIKYFDDKPRPFNWRMSPQAVCTYILGGTLPDGFVVAPKYIGQRRLIETAVATLATDRALLLIGLPGTAKSWVAEHITAAVSGDSALLVQGTAGLGEEALRYGWNYAKLLAEGPSESALVKSPVMRGMEEGKIVRIEELTRISSDVQDALITVLSEKILPIPELDALIAANKGFNIIATANDRDRGVHELSAALKRRFNMVYLPLPDSLEDEVRIVDLRVRQHIKELQLPAEIPAYEEIKRLVTVFRELREGKTIDGKSKIKSPSATLSTAEIISVMNSGLSLAAYFGNGKICADDMAAGLTGAVIRDAAQDKIVWEEYLNTIIRTRDSWQDLFKACKKI
jgi:MoxR-like ATPase